MAPERSKKTTKTINIITAKSKMSESPENINPWAEKLQQVTIPGITPSWEAMQALLDLEMPVTKRKDRRRWFLLIILLLLLIGVCNCPGILKTNRLAKENTLPVNPGMQKNEKEIKPVTGSSVEKWRDSATMNNIAKTATGKTADTPDEKNTGDHKADRTNYKPHSNSKEATGSPKNNRLLNDEKFYVHGKADTTSPDSIYSPGEKNSIRKISNKKKIQATAGNTQNPKPNVQNPVDKDGSEPLDTPTAKNSTAPLLTGSTKAGNTDSLKKQLSTIAKAEKKKTDTATKKTGDKKSKRIALAAGLGLNQFFTVGSQQHSDYNSGGTSGILSDYIPVPMLRAYLSKKLYIQLEAQFNTPQYTKKLLAKEVITYDTIGGIPVQSNQHSVFIKKLFYFNIPLSIYYSPFKNFYIGTGLQFSRLTNGVGLFENTQISSGPNLVTESKVGSFKDDAAYKVLKTNEWRFLFDANYQWKNLSGGIRYNQAFNNFINTRISGTEVTQARNSSIQLYLKYILWRNKKTKELFSK
jgi:hypothetical protein